MLSLGIAATMLSFVPLADRCSAMLTEAACVPEAETPVLSKEKKGHFHIVSAALATRTLMRKAAARLKAELEALLCQR